MISLSIIVFSVFVAAFILIPSRDLFVAKIVFAPWAFFFIMLAFFQMYEETDVLASSIIFLAITLSAFGALAGQRVGKSFATPLGVRSAGMVRVDRSKSFRVVLVLGLLSGLLIVTEKARAQLHYLLALDFFQLRMSVAMASDFSSTGMINNFLMLIFSIGFISLFLGSRQFESRFWYLCNCFLVGLICLYVLLGGGRMVVFYSILLVLLRAYVEGIKVKPLVVICFSLITLAMASIFYLRVPSGPAGALEYYNVFFGLKKNVAFFGLYEGRGLVSDLVYIVGIYFTHSFQVFSEFLQSPASQELSYGAYTFSLPIRIFETLLNLDLLFDRYLADASVGYYATFLRDPIADFGLYAAFSYSYFIAFAAGFYYNLRHLHWSCYVSFYYCALCLVMAPLISVVSSGLMFMAFWASTSISVLFIFFLIVSKRLGGRR